MMKLRPQAEQDAYAEGVNSALTTIIDVIDAGASVKEIKAFAVAAKHNMGVASA